MVGGAGRPGGGRSPGGGGVSWPGREARTLAQTGRGGKATSPEAAGREGSPFPMLRRTHERRHGRAGAGMPIMSMMLGRP